MGRSPRSPSHASSPTRRSAAPALLAAGIGVLLCGAACAGLGDAADSVDADRAQLRAALRASIAAPAYTVHEMQLPTGTVVREYIAAGRVFAVSWRGPVLPDLRALLAASFATFRDAPRTPGSGRSHASVELPGLVVHSAGHPRSFAGLAYLPQALPAGVSPEELQ